LGDGVSISQDYLNSMQDMLDSGQMTAEELQKIMRVQGYEMHFDGWKRVPGATRYLTVTTGYGTADAKTTTTEEVEELVVPIINGQDPSKGQSFAKGTT
jgi:hypothetical protein